MNKKYWLISSAFILVLATGIVIKSYGTDKAEVKASNRWYTKSQLSIGKAIFDNNCSVCHGTQGQGLAEDWKQPLADGSYPPPPLNGTAHTWHHPVSQLIRTINSGGVPLGGKMPAFGEKLSDEEKIAVIAYFQNWWPDNVYEAWIERGGMEN